MKKAILFFESIPGVAVVTALLLLIPLVAMQFTGEVNWSVSDFIIMGIVIFSTGAAYVLIARFAPNFIYKAAIASAIGSTFLIIWVNLAVGLIGSGPNTGNMMYIGVVAVALFGTFLSRFTPAGMERAMFATALALVLHTVIALLMKMDEYPDSSVKEIIAVNAFFATLFSVSGLLFRFVALTHSSEKSKV
jgi:hypothetical protein